MIGFLEIRRRKLQFALIGVVVALISYLVLMINGLGVGLNEQAGRALRNFDADAIAYSDRAGLSVIRSELSAETLERVRTESGARESAALGYMAVNYRRDDGRVKSAAVLGFDPGTIGEPPVTGGRGLMSEDANALLADRQFLKASGLRVGDSVRLSVRLQEREFTIVGELNEGAFFFQPSVYMLRSTWQEMKYGMGDAATPVASVVLLKGDGLAGKRGQGWEAVSKATAFANIEGVSGQQSTVQALRVFGYLIGGLVIGVFFYVLTIQKTPQIGVLKAVGATSGFIFRQLLIQALLIALGGVVVAVPLAWLTNEGIKQAPDPVPIAFTTGTFVTTSVLLLAMALVGVLFSGRQVAKVDPIIALGQQQ